VKLARKFACTVACDLMHALLGDQRLSCTRFPEISFSAAKGGFWIVDSRSRKQGFDGASLHRTQSHGRDTRSKWKQSRVPRMLVAMANAASPALFYACVAPFYEVMAENRIATSQQVARRGTYANRSCLVRGGKGVPARLPQPVPRGYTYKLVIPCIFS
jgi:hypothetical protein